MRSWFNDASLSFKLMALMALSTTLAVALAALGLGTYETITFRRALAQKLTTVAEIVGRNSTAALAFGDHAVARDILRAMETEPSVETGLIFDKDGHPFAEYDSPTAPSDQPDTPGPEGARFEGGRLVVVQPIMLDGDPVGTVYLRASLGELTSRMQVFGSLTLLVMMVSTALALAMSIRLQRRIASPIVSLAETARRVTSDRNFSVRAEAAGRDEVGRLVEDFNRMLAEIEGQDHQLRRQQDRLTEEVAARTAALQAANTQLTASVHRTERYANQIAQLTALGQLLQSCLTTDEVFGVVPHAMRQLFPDGSGALTLMEPSGNVMETMAMWGDNPPHQSVFEPAECWAFRRGRPHVVVDPASPLRCAHLRRGDGPVSFCVPMNAQGDHLGVLQFSFAPGEEVDAVDENGAPRSTRARLVVALAEQIALALANLRLREALRSQSIVDPLTGLFNRRYLETVLERECRRVSRAGRQLTVMMLDVDHFKAFNDTWGHEGGDFVLRELAGLLRAHFRGDDVACRYGGEEFVVMLSEASIDSAFERAEQFRIQIRRLCVEYRKRALGRITVSIGLASLPEHGTAPEELIAAADRALYTAKTEGRDRTERATAQVRALPPQNPAAEEQRG